MHCCAAANGIRASTPRITRNAVDNLRTPIAFLLCCIRWPPPSFMESYLGTLPVVAGPGENAALAVALPARASWQLGVH